MTKQPTTNNLNYLIHRTFNSVDILFVLPSENEDDATSFSNYYTQKV